MRNRKYKIEDYIGEEIYYFRVVGPSEERAKDKSIQWRFECICGKFIDAPPSRVIDGHKKSCGCMRYKEIKHKEHNRENLQKVDAQSLIGKRNNRLEVIGYERPKEKGRTRLKCLCDCGNMVYVLPYQFKSGAVKSCGCACFGHSECHKGNTSRRTHGLTKNRFYKKWNDMVRRCHDQREPAFAKYGKMGITVCEEWRLSPEKFIEWCEKTHPEGPMLTIDRIDGTKGYSPDNCRWATQLEQVHNLRNNRFVTIDGETHCVTEWCRLNGLSAGSVYKRVHKGQTFEQAISELIALKAAPVE